MSAPQSCWLTPPIDVRPLTDFTSFGSVRLATARDGRPQVVAHDGVPGTHDLYYLDLTQGSASYYYAQGQAVAQRSTDLLQEASHIHYLHRDRLGSLTEVTDEGGDVVGRARYGAYGRVLSSTIPLTLTTRLYAWSDYDPDTGLYKIGARWYDPQLGVWLTPDSLVPDVNNPIAWNGYAFNYQNPVNFVDPSGHIPIWDFLDVYFFYQSLIAFFANPNPATGLDLLLDAADLAPGITGLGKVDEFAGAARKAYLLGCAGVNDEALEQVLELSRHYGDVYVNDIDDVTLSLMKRRLEKTSGIPQNVHFLDPGDAADLDKIDDADIFVVAPNPDWMYGPNHLQQAFFGTGFTESPLAEALNKVVGEGSKGYVITELGTRDFVKFLEQYEWSGEIVRPYARGTKIAQGVSIDSWFFRGSWSKVQMIVVGR